MCGRVAQPGESTALIMPGSWVRIPPLLFRTIVTYRPSAPRNRLGTCHLPLKGAVMTFRVLALVVGAACTAALPARAQKRGSFEVGGFAAYVNADNSLPVDNALGFGGRAGVNAFSKPSAWSTGRELSALT